MRRYLATALLVASAWAPSQSQSPQDSQNSGLLASLVQEYWQWVLRDNLDFRMKRGLKIEKLPDISFEKARADAALAGSLLIRLHRIKPAALREDHRITFALLQFQLPNIVDTAPH